jgi:hypothetical protein
MDGYLSFNNIISIPVWKVAGRYPIIPTNFYTHYYISALDGVRWSAFYRLSGTPVLEKIYVILFHT